MTRDGCSLCYPSSPVTVVGAALKLALCHLNDRSLDHVDKSASVQLPSPIATGRLVKHDTFRGLFNRPWQMEDRELRAVASVSSAQGRQEAFLARADCQSRAAMRNQPIADRPIRQGHSDRSVGTIPYKHYCHWDGCGHSPKLAVPKGNHIMSEKLRRAVAERVRANAVELGLNVEDDPVYMAALAQWISGEISMPEFRDQYLSLLFARAEHDLLRRAFEQFKPHLAKLPSEPDEPVSENA